MDGHKYYTVLQENLFKSDINLRVGTRFILQHDNDPKHEAKVTLEWLKNRKVNVLEWLSQSPDLKPIEKLWHYLKTAVRRHRLTNLEDLYKFC